MKNCRNFGILFIGLVFLLGSFVALNSEVSREPLPKEKTWKFIDPPQAVKDSIEPKVDEDMTMLDDLWNSLRNANAQQLNTLRPLIEAAFAGTFLKNPEITELSGQTVAAGWSHVLSKLHEYATKEDTSIGDIDIDIDYKTYDKDKKPDPENDKDLRVFVKVKLRNVGSDLLLRGCYDHRRTCEPVECQ